MNVSLDMQTVLFTRKDSIPDSVAGLAFHNDPLPECLEKKPCETCALRRFSRGGPLPDSRACILVWSACGCRGPWKEAEPK